MLWETHKYSHAAHAVASYIITPSVNLQHGKPMPSAICSLSITELSVFTPSSSSSLKGLLLTRRVPSLHKEQPGRPLIGASMLCCVLFMVRSHPLHIWEGWWICFTEIQCKFVHKTWITRINFLFKLRGALLLFIVSIEHFPYIYFSWNTSLALAYTYIHEVYNYALVSLADLPALSHAQ